MDKAGCQVGQMALLVAFLEGLGLTVDMYGVVKKLRIFHILDCTKCFKGLLVLASSKFWRSIVGHRL